MTNKTVTVTAFEDTSLEWFDCSPKAFLKFWQEKIVLIPDEYSESATINLDVDDCFGVPVMSALITYERPETETDREAAAAKERQREDKLLQKELAELYRLQQKYPDAEDVR